MIETDEGAAEGRHVWMVFGDLMAGLLGLFVLFFVWLVVFQLDLATTLRQEKTAHAAVSAQLEAVQTERAAEVEAHAVLRRAEDERRADLARALATPLATGRVSLKDGRIGIAGAVLFDRYSAALRPEGEAVLAGLAAPLSGWLAREDEMLMVGGFTDDLPIRDQWPEFIDNWQLSTERALTVVRELARLGVPPDRMFAAGFGEYHPAIPNQDEAARSQNRRVEIVPQRRKDQ